MASSIMLVPKFRSLYDLLRVFSKEKCYLNVNWDGYNYTLLIDGSLTVSVQTPSGTLRKHYENVDDWAIDHGRGLYVYRR